MEIKWLIVPLGYPNTPSLIKRKPPLNEMWSIGGREIIYGKTYQRKKFLIEELQISNAEYMPYLTDNEPNDNDE